MKLGVVVPCYRQERFLPRTIGAARGKIRPEMVHDYEARARNHILQHYSWDNVAENTESVYRGLLDGNQV